MVGVMTHSRPPTVPFAFCARDGLPNRGPKMVADARVIRDRDIFVMPVGDSVT
jgi:hypothetical protein